MFLVLLLSNVDVRLLGYSLVCFLDISAFIIFFLALSQAADLLHAPGPLT